MNAVMEDFEKKIQKDVVIEVVNLTRATLKEANQFKLILQEDIEKKFRKIVIDISQCEFLDSTFLGTLVLAKKSMDRIGGALKIVEPASVFQVLMEKTSTLQVFETYKSLDEAVNSF
ncbi:MAG: STAS domain-containing protein [Ignavibacteriaceae bacterium]